MFKFVDTLLPVFVGHRTEFLGFGSAILALLGSFHVVDPAKVQQALEVVVPLAVSTLGAKITRQGQQTAQLAAAAAQQGAAAGAAAVVAQVATPVRSLP